MVKIISLQQYHDESVPTYVARGVCPLAASAICMSCGSRGYFWGGRSSKVSSEANPRWLTRLHTIEWLASRRRGPEPLHVEAVGAHSRSRSDARGHALGGPSTTNQ